MPRIIDMSNAGLAGASQTASTALRMQRDQERAAREEDRYNRQVEAADAEQRSRDAAAQIMAEEFRSEFVDPLKREQKKAQDFDEANKAFGPSLPPEMRGDWSDEDLQQLNRLTSIANKLEETNPEYARRFLTTQFQRQAQEEQAQKSASFMEKVNKYMQPDASGQPVFDETDTDEIAHWQELAANGDVDRAYGEMSKHLARKRQQRSDARIAQRMVTQIDAAFPANATLSDSQVQAVEELRDWASTGDLTYSQLKRGIADIQEDTYQPGLLDSLDPEETEMRQATQDQAGGLMKRVGEFFAPEGNELLGLGIGKDKPEGAAPGSMKSKKDGAFSKAGRMKQFSKMSEGERRQASQDLMSIFIDEQYATRDQLMQAIAEYGVHPETIPKELVDEMMAMRERQMKLRREEPGGGN